MTHKKPVYRKKILSNIEKESLVYILIDYIDDTTKIGITLNKLEREIRKIHFRWAGKQLPDRSPMVYISKILRSYNIPLSLIMSSSRNDEVVLARREIAVTLVREGFNYSQVGRIIKKHPSSIRKMVLDHVESQEDNSEKEQDNENHI